jgi:hypothetical protein
MDFKKAICILDLNDTFTEKELRKAYYKKAILWHPDKNRGAGEEAAKDKFQNLGEAYAFLQKHKKITIENVPTTLREIIERCLSFLKTENKWEDIFLQTTIRTLLLNYKKIPIKIFEALTKEKSLEIYDFLFKHKDIFSISDEWLERMKEIIKKKMVSDCIIVLNPTIDNMLDDTIYKLTLENKTFYVPLWHHELCYDASGKDIIVNCIPELEDHIILDDNNNLYVTIKSSITEILNREKLVVTLGAKVFEIPSSELKIKKQQYYMIYNKGVLKVDTNDMYNTSCRGDIHLRINLY